MKKEDTNNKRRPKRTSWKSFIGGDILATDFVRRQAKQPL